MTAHRSRDPELCLVYPISREPSVMPLCHSGVRSYWACTHEGLKGWGLPLSSSQSSQRREDSPLEKVGRKVGVVGKSPV
jgi:hypothetical protein